MTKENNLKEHEKRIEFIEKNVKNITLSTPADEYFNIILLTIASSLIEVAINAYIEIENKEEDSIRKLIAENFYNCIMKKQPIIPTENVIDFTNIIN